jgi:Gly-Xaa carboxypeptidase
VWRALVGTTTAVDMIQGGVKSNALPEQAWAVVNHRIDVASSVSDVKRADAELLRDLAKHFNLSYTAFGERLTEADDPAWGTLDLSDAWGSALEPAPVSPISGGPYNLLAGTIRATYSRRRANAASNQEVFIAPGIMAGNTDTRFYWGLSNDIFRYDHTNVDRDEGPSGVHTVNESMPVDVFLEMMEFFLTLILNINEARF